MVKHSGVSSNIYLHSNKESKGSVLGNCDVNSVECKFHYKSESTRDRLRLYPILYKSNVAVEYWHRL